MSDQTSNRQELIESRVNREMADGISISREAGGVDIRKLGEVMEAAKLMSLSGSMVPAFLRENPGGCFGIIWKAYHWGMDPFAVASMAYEVEQKRTKEKTVAFMSQLIRAVIEKRAPIKGRLKIRYEGEGDDRVCIVSGTFIGDTEPTEHRSPKLGDRRPKGQGKDTRDPRPDTVDDDPRGGSPLWKTKPDVQLAYDTQRDFARVYCPDVILGVYDPEEMKEAGYDDVRRMPAQQQVDIDDKLSTRLTGTAMERAGFNLGGVVAEANAAHANGNASQSPTDSDAEAAGSVTPLSEPAASKPKQTRTRKSKETTPAPDTSPSAAPATTSDENLPTQSQVVVPTEEASQAVAAAAEPPPETPEVEQTEERKAQLTEARKAGGRAYYNGQPRSEGQRKYPTDEGSRAAWHEGYDERRDRERGSARS